MRIDLTIRRQERIAAPPRALFVQAARLTIERAASFDLPPSLELSLLLTNDEKIRALNREYRGLDKPTDVLSFPLWQGADDPLWPVYLADPAQAPSLPLGDIVISLETAELQARELKHSKERETLFLFVHGLLHLLGYDHELGAAEERRMFDLQKRIMTDLEV